MMLLDRCTAGTWSPFLSALLFAYEKKTQTVFASDPDGTSYSLPRTLMQP
jgi:hypothetical protein